MKKPKIFFYKKIKDKRGYFSEIYLQKILKKTFVQDNLVFNKKKNTFRGLHYQQKPYEQGKLITVIRGSIIDYICEVKKNINQYILKKYQLTEYDNKCLWVPSNYAHGYLTCEDNTIVLYKVTKLYNPEYEKKINIFREEIHPPLNFKKKKIIISKKDS